MSFEGEWVRTSGGVGVSTLTLDPETYSAGFVEAEAGQTTYGVSDLSLRLTTLQSGYVELIPVCDLHVQATQSKVIYTDEGSQGVFYRWNVCDGQFFALYYETNLVLDSETPSLGAFPDSEGNFEWSPSYLNCAQESLEDPPETLNQARAEVGAYPGVPNSDQDGFTLGPGMYALPSENEDVDEPLYVELYIYDTELISLDIEDYRIHASSSNRLARWEFEPATENEGSGDGEPPETEPTPVPNEPVEGGCKASLDGPSGCNWILPPGRPEMPKPGDLFPEPDGFPIDRFKQREFPPLDCRLPNFGNQGPCPPIPGTGGSLPGGYDSSGAPASGGGGGGGSVHTGGPTTEAREKKTFAKKTCYRKGSSVMTTIMMLMVEMGISPVRIVFEIGFEWDKTFGRCWQKGQRKWDACVWLAERIGCIIIDEGDGYVYIGPPFVKPGQRTHVFDENVDLFAMERSSSSQDAYYAVEVFGPTIDPPVISFVEAPFDISPDNILRIEVGPNYSRAEAEQLAALRAGRMRQDLAGIQVTVPYAPDILPYEYYMRDKMVIQSPSRGIQETYIIVAKASDLSFASGRFNILTGLLPATLEQMEKMPSVMDSGVSGADMFPDLAA